MEPSLQFDRVIDSAAALREIIKPPAELVAESLTEARPQLERRLALLHVTALNMSNMILRA